MDAMLAFALLIAEGAGLAYWIFRRAISSLGQASKPRRIDVIAVFTGGPVVGLAAAFTLLRGGLPLAAVAQTVIVVTIVALIRYAFHRSRSGKQKY